MGQLVRATMLLGAVLVSTAANACETCRPAVRAAVYDGDFPKTLAILLLPLVILAAIGLGIYRSDAGGRRR